MGLWNHIAAVSSIFGNSSNQTEDDSTYKKYKREIDKFRLEPPPIVKAKEAAGELDKIKSIEDVMKHFGATEKSTQKPMVKK